MAKLKWGHNMEVDGLPRMKELTYRAYAPDGTFVEAKVEEGGDFWFDLTADTDQEGFYTVITPVSYTHLVPLKWNMASYFFIKETTVPLSYKRKNAS